MNTDTNLYGNQKVDLFCMKSDSESVVGVSIDLLREHGNIVCIKYFLLIRLCASLCQGGITVSISSISSGDMDSPIVVI